MMAKNILKKLLLIQQELKVPKNQFNSFGKYNYRSCEDILESARPIANKNNCVIVINDDIKEINGRYYVEATITLFDVESGEEISTKALAREAEPKSGMSESQLTGACSSYARKYALSAMFALDDEKDDDTRDNRQQSKQINKPATKQKPIDEKTKHLSSVFNKMKTHNVSKQGILSILKTNFNKTSSKDLTLQEVKELDENFNNYLGQIMITETE
nr:MAG TPA: ERF superfamily protein [Caudoviricetes sp.]